ncbi:hypothetical protein P4050_15970 [Pseudomonas aeruginosa]|nr:hypothetical protein [Pseudomonas aeruginosa]
MREDEIRTRREENLRRAARLDPENTHKLGEDFEAPRQTRTVNRPLLQICRPGAAAGGTGSN